jgi:tRNA-2-methylthio-N6-dimethylallyladenosine synthase
MNYCIITYGCQMNEADSDLMAALLAHAGWTECGSPESANLVILNTCSVREKPEQKVYTRLGQLRRWKESRPRALLAVTGCMAQREGRRLLKRAPHVDLVLGTRWFHRIAEFVARACGGEHPIVELELDQDPSAVRCREGISQGAASLRAFVPIIRGCSNFCTYCIVPFVRGYEVSREPKDVLREVHDLVRRGTREVTLLGQNVLAYGRDLSEESSFPDLLHELAQVPDLWRIRFTTCHPRDVTSELLSAIADRTAVCEHIHLPIQAGADRLLEEMNRGYTTTDYLALVEQFRSRVPGIAITTDIMVGFPGESNEEFEESLRLYERIGFDAAFTFAYSPRPGTAAAKRKDQVPRQTSLARLQRLIALQNRITLERNQAGVGQEAEVLVDGPAPRGEGLLAGRAPNNKQVIFAGARSLQRSLVPVRLTEAHLWGFKAVFVDH